MKSKINSEKVKKIVLKALEKALDECAYQQDAHGLSYEGYDYNNLNNVGLPTPLGLIDPTEEMKKITTLLPSKLELSIDIHLKNDSDHKKSIRIFCNPIIDLSKLSFDE